MKKVQALYAGCFGALLVMALTVIPVRADNDKQGIARAAMMAGKIAPLSKLLSMVEISFPGDVLKVEIELEDVRKWGGEGEGKIYIYEIKVLTLEGNLVKLKYDATSLSLLMENGMDRMDRRDRHDRNDYEDNHD